MIFLFVCFSKKKKKKRELYKSGDWHCSGFLESPESNQEGLNFHKVPKKKVCKMTWMHKNDHTIAVTTTILHMHSLGERACG